MKKQRTLTREKICEAALTIVNAEGLESLGMRRVARELGVEAASLYNHIKDKSELLDLIQENMFLKLVIPKKNNDWKKYLTLLAHSMRSGLLKYPNIVPLLATRPSVTPTALIQSERTFGVLYKTGFTYQEIIYAYQSLTIFVLGHLQAEVGSYPGSKPEQEPSFSQFSDENKFPHLLKAYSEMEMMSYDNWFDFGINLIIAGLENVLTIKGK